MKVLDWTIKNGLLDVNCENFSHTIPVRNITGFTREKPAEHQSGCIIHVYTDDGRHIYLSFETLALASTFRADLRIALCK